MPRLHALNAPGDVLDDVLLLEQLVALGVGVHQAVLDAVVHHLRVVPGPDLAGVDEALVAGPSGRSASKIGIARFTFTARLRRP